MLELLKETYYILLPIIATALIGWVGMILKDQKKDREEYEKNAKAKEEEINAIRKANSNGIKLVLRYMLKRYHTEYVVQGRITYSQYKDWMDIYKAYAALKGNSIAEEWNEDIEHLEKCDSLSEMTVFESLVRETVRKNNQKD